MTLIDTPAQRLLAHHAAAPDPSVLNLCYALALDGPFDTDAFGWALARLVEAYPALGSAAARDGDGWDVIDGRDLPDHARRSLVEGRLDYERTTPFDLGKPDCVRAAAIRLAADRHVLILNFHHAAADAWLLSRYARLLSQAYASVSGRESAGEPGSRDRTAIRSAADLEGRRAADSAGLVASLAGLSLRECDPFPAARSATLLRWCAGFDAAFIRALAAAATAERVTVFGLLAGIVAETVCSDYGLPSLLLGTTTMNRNSSIDLAAHDVRYGGAVFRAANGGERPLRRTASAAAAAAERLMSYDEQLVCVARALGRAEPIEPAIFLLSDQYPMTDLRLRGLGVATLVVEASPTELPRPVHSPRCGRIAVFWRTAPGGATLNLFAGQDLEDEAGRLFGAIRQALSARCGPPDAAAPLVLPWEAGLAKTMAPPVDALSPVSLPRAEPPDREGDDR